MCLPESVDSREEVNGFSSVVGDGHLFGGLPARQAFNLHRQLKHTHGFQYGEFRDLASEGLEPIKNHVLRHEGKPRVALVHFRPCKFVPKARQPIQIVIVSLGLGYPLPLGGPPEKLRYFRYTSAIIRQGAD
jgi:hypothetical protein